MWFLRLDWYKVHISDFLGLLCQRSHCFFFFFFCLFVCLFFFFDTDSIAKASRCWRKQVFVLSSRKYSYKYEHLRLLRKEVYLSEAPVIATVVCLKLLLRSHNLVLFCPYAIAYSYLEFKLRYLKT